MSATDDLSDRERRILAAIVELHIDRREPVGSKTLTQQTDLALSPATIRAVMAALTERGLLEKPHTSAGRIPTGRGLRFYVDSLLEVERPKDEDAAQIRARIAPAHTLDEAMGEAGRVLSRLARQACVIRAPRADTVRLTHVELLRLRDDAMLCILVGDDGRVQNRLVDVRPEVRERLQHLRLPDAELARLSRIISERAKGRTLPALAEELSREIDEDKEAALSLVKALLGEALRADLERALPLLVAGSDLLLAQLPDGADEGALSRVRDLYRVLEEKQQILALLDSAADAPGTRIFIGHESGLGQLADMALVTATYGRGRDIFGTLGVLGPMHMDYGRVVPLVALTAEAVSGVLEP